MLAKTDDFRNSISDLRTEIDHVIGSIAQCAAVTDRINQLVGVRDRAQNAVNHLTEMPKPQETDCPEKQVEWLQRMKQLVEPVAATDPEIGRFLGPLLSIPEALPTDPGRLRDLCAEVESARVNEIKTLTQEIAGWNQEISTLYNPFPSAETRGRSFIAKLREVLCHIPVAPRELREVRSEIERLSIWDMVRKRAPLGMKGAMVDLVSLRGRLDELLGYLPNLAGGVAVDQPRGFETGGISTDGSVMELRKPHGPKPAMERHHQIAFIVNSFGNDWRQKDTLEKIAEKLDRAMLSLPRAWNRWERVPRTWGRAVEYHADRVCKVLTYSLEMAARPNSRQTPGTPAARS